MNAKQLFDAIFNQLQDSERILIASANEGNKGWVRQLTESIEEALTLAAALDAKGRDVYFGVAPRDAENMDTVTRVTCLWADIDTKDFEGDKKAALDAASSAFIAPLSFLVNSGHGFHCYWLLSSSLDGAVAKSTMIEIQKLQGGDFTYDATRLLRVPGTLNRKRHTPVACKMLRARTNLRYDPSDLLSLTRMNSKVARRMLTGSRRGFKSRSERDWNAVVELLQLGVTQSCIHMLFEELPIGDKVRESGQAYLLRTITQARARVQAQTTTHLFSSQEDCFVITTAQGARKKVSTFVFKPTKLLHGPSEDVLLGSVRASGREWKGVALPKSAFAGTSALLKRLPVAFWQWIGSDREVRILLPFLMAQLQAEGTPSAEAVYHIGRVDNFWVAPQTTFDISRTYGIQEAPVVYIKSGREVPQVDYTFPDDDTYSALIREIFELLPQINLPTVVWPILGWYAATPLKPLLNQAGIRFPILNLYGSRGGGKTSTLLRVMQPLFGFTEPRSYDCVTTQFVMLALLASTNAVPISFSEFRRSTMNEREHARLMRYLLLAYDIGHDTRGRADQTTQDYPLSAPITIDGEDAFADAAARERAVIVNLDPGEIEVGSSAWEAFDALTMLPLRDFAGRYIRSTLCETVTSSRELFDISMGLLQKAVTQKLPDRVRRNLALCLTGLRILKRHVEAHGAIAGAGAGIPALSKDFISDIFKSTLDITVLSKTGRTSALVDEFIEDLINQVSLSDARKPFFYRYIATKNLLWFHLSTALNWWFAKRRREGKPALESAAMKTQLRERDQERRSGPGQYVISRKAVNIDKTTRWCYGLDLEVCHACLDVPSRLNDTTVVIHV